MGKAGDRGTGTRQGPRLDKMIHERTRLMILAYLAADQQSSVPFTVLKETIGLSAGNLSIQLRNLGEAGYVEIMKKFIANKPNTSVRLTQKGSRALMEYLGQMESLINRLRPDAGSNGIGARGASGKVKEG